MKNTIHLITALLLCLLLTACFGNTDEAASSSIVSSMPSESVPPSKDASLDNSVEVSSLPASSQPPLTQTITIPEGFTLARIAMLLEEKGFCTVEEFIAASQEGDFSEFTLAVKMQQVEESCFKLEGILFPDTYEVYTGESPDAIIRRMLAHTEQMLGEKLMADIAASPYSVSEIFTLASIIEKEAYGAAEMNNISSVLHNRLDSGMKLQCDVTINYVEGAIKPFIDGDKDRFNSLYNTYKCPALPAGPICNPGLDAINAAINPADTDYLFFLTDKDKNFLYAATYEVHLENIKTAGIVVPTK